MAKREKGKFSNCVGELKEIDALVQEKEVIETGISYTKTCTGVFSIFCC